MTGRFLYISCLGTAVSVAEGASAAKLDIEEWWRSEIGCLEMETIEINVKLTVLPLHLLRRRRAPIVLPFGGGFEGRLPYSRASFHGCGSKPLPFRIEVPQLS